MYEKIVIIGSPGAGKTTFAQKLGDILKIQVFHLDHHFWLPGWKEKPIQKRIDIQLAFIQEEKWIIEGTYLDSSDVRLNAADTIIFLNMPVWLCMWHSIKRRIEYRNKQRVDLAEGCHEKLQLSYILKVFAFPFRGRRSFFAKLRNLRERDANKSEAETVHYVQLCSKEEVEGCLYALRTLQGGQTEQILMQESPAVEVAEPILTRV